METAGTAIRCHGPVRERTRLAEALLEAGEPFAFLYQVTNADGKKYEATVAIERPRRLWQR